MTSAIRTIPRTPILLRYKRLRNATQAERLLEAEHFARYPEELAAEFAASISHFASYDNEHEDFFDSRPSHLPGAAIKSTPDLVLRLEKVGHVTPLEADERLRAQGRVEGLQDVPAADLAFEYVHRELLLQRTTSPARWEDGARNVGGIRPDVVLANLADRTPIVGELKIGDDMDPFFALLQALACVAHLATSHQYERMRNHLEKGRFPPLDGPPQFDIYILFAGVATGSNHPAFKSAADSLALRLPTFEAVSRSVRRIAGLDMAVTTDDAPTASVRFAWESAP